MQNSFERQNFHNFHWKKLPIDKLVRRFVENSMKDFLWKTSTVWTTFALKAQPKCPHGRLFLSAVGISVVSALYQCTVFKLFLAEPATCCRILVLLSVWQCQSSWLRTPRFELLIQEPSEGTWIPLNVQSRHHAVGRRYVNSLVWLANCEWPVIVTFHFFQTQIR